MGYAGANDTSVNDGVHSGEYTCFHSSYGGAAYAGIGAYVFKNQPNYISTGSSHKVSVYSSCSWARSPGVYSTKDKAEKNLKYTVEPGVKISAGYRQLRIPEKNKI